MACRFIRDVRIDSFQKLRILLWLTEHRQQPLSVEELAGRVYLGDMGFVEEILTSLAEAGIVNCQDDRYVFSCGDDTKRCLHCLEEKFADPQARQGLLQEIRRAETAAGDEEGCDADDG